MRNNDTTFLSANKHADAVLTMAKATEPKTFTGSSDDDVYYVNNRADKIIENPNQGKDSVYSSSDYVLPTNVENLTLVGNQNIYGSGNNSDNTLIGNTGHNRLNSGRGNDTVYGHDGNDNINGGEGNDSLYGDSGDDNINGEEGNDYLFGGEGNDTLNGGKGDDMLSGGAGEDTYIFKAGSGFDTIIDHQGVNTVRLDENITLEDLNISSTTDAEGNISLIIKLNEDSQLTVKNQYTKSSYKPAVQSFMVGSKTYDAYEIAQKANISITAPAEHNPLDIRGSKAGETLNGTEGNDKLYGYEGDDTLYGNKGHDEINGGSGADTMYGGAGNDLYYVDNKNDKVIEKNGEGVDEVKSWVSHTLNTNVENLILMGNANIFGSGNNSDNILKGNAGNNRLNSGRGNDTVYGDGGDDTLNGGEGHDQLHGDDGHDYLNGEEGNDALYGGASNDTYVFGRGYDSDTITDSLGSNTVRFDNSVTLQNLSLQSIKNDKGGTDWLISISDTADNLSISNQFSSDGKTSISSFIVEGKTYTAQAFFDALNQPEAGLVLSGTDEDNVLTGTAGNDKIDGGSDGRDKLYGKDGDDVIVEHSRTYYGGTWADRDDYLDGGAGNDSLHADTGSDYLDGGTGNDFIEGGDGSDTYIFGKGYGHDVIFDYTLTSDFEYLNTHSNRNRVSFVDGITPDDLEISIYKGYHLPDTLLNSPLDKFYTTHPVTNGDTWIIKVKNTDDTLTILNQKPVMGAIAVFEFANQSYTASEFFELKHKGLSGEEITAQNASQIYTIDKDGHANFYGTSDQDNFHFGQYREEYTAAYSLESISAYGGNGNDKVHVGREGEQANISFYGGNGDDSLSVTSANNPIKVFDGGKGNDKLDGYNSHIETIVFRAGDGHDTIVNQHYAGISNVTPSNPLHESKPEIHFTGGLTLNDLDIRYTGDKTVITVKDTGDTVTLGVNSGDLHLPDYSISALTVSSIRFDSGETYSLEDLIQNHPLPTGLADLGGNTVTPESAAIPAGYTASVNKAKISSLKTAENGLSDDGLFENTAKENALDNAINQMTAAPASSGNSSSDHAVYANIASDSFVTMNEEPIALI